MHDVDEDARTIVRHGGWHVDGNLSGFTCRLMYFDKNKKI